MSLSSYLEQHAPIRDAFKALHNSAARKIPPSALLAPSQTKNPSFVGTAFDYLARIDLSKRLPPAVALHTRPWVAEQCAERLEWKCTKVEAKRWRKLLLGANDEISGMEMGEAQLPRMLDLVQMLAHADYLMRYPDGFDPSFKPTPEVSADLVTLLRVFQTAKGFQPSTICIMNPVFQRSRDVEGADADLILDSTLIEIKVVKEMKAEIDHVLQLAGYAVLQKLGGIDLGTQRYDKPFTHVGIYFARHGKLVTWSMSELFPAAGFDKFAKMFVEELPRWKRSMAMV